MAEKRQRRRLDTRPQNRPDVQLGVTKSHLDMQGNLSGGTLATGEKVGTKDPANQMGGRVGLGGIKRRDMSLEGFYQRNPRLKRTGTNAEKFDPSAASGRKTVKRRLKASREYLTKEAEATKKEAADHAAAPPPKVFAPDPFNPGEQVEIKPAAPGAPAPAPAPAPGGGGAGKGLDVGKVQGAKGGLGKKDPAEKAPEPQQPAPAAGVDPNRPGGGGGGDPTVVAKPAKSTLTPGEGVSRQGAREREALAAGTGTGTGPQSRILKNEEGIVQASEQLAAVQLKETELNKLMEEQKRRQDNMSRGRNTVQKGPQMDQR